MIINNVLWVRCVKLTYLRHLVHYYVACGFVVLFLPSVEYKAFTGVKWSFLVVTLFLFQLAIAQSICPTGLHQAITCTATLAHLVKEFKIFH